MLKNRTLAVLGALALLLSLVATPNSSAQTSIALDPAVTSRVRIVHASPDAGAVDVYVDGAKRLANVSFFTASDYLNIPAGSHLVQVTATGTPTSTAVISSSVNLTADRAYSIAAVGEAASGATNKLGATLITDTLTLPEANNARIRAYHFSPDTPPVNVRVKGTSTPLIANLAFPNASDSINVVSGTYDLEVVVPGTSTTTEIVVPINGVKFEAGKLYDIFAVGKLANRTLRFETKVTNATARLRVIHASPNAPAVDVYVDDTKRLSNVPFFTISDYLEIPAGPRRVRVTVAGQPIGTAVIDVTPTLEVGRFYTASAVGLVNGTPALQAKLTVDDLSAPPIGTSRVRVYHFSPDAPTVNLRIKNGPTLISNLSFPNVSSDVVVPTGTYDLEVFATIPPVVVPLNGVKIDSGKIYEVFATDRVATIKFQSKIYGPNGTAPYVTYFPQVGITTGF